MTQTAILPKRMAIGALLACAVLLIPLVAMSFTDEVNWSATDFLAGAVLLGGTGAIIGAATALNVSAAVKGAIALAAMAALLLIWVQLI
ncbi:MAG: hypothetical protein AAFY10_14155 [Pseudomonadota bacterium]